MQSTSKKCVKAEQCSTVHDLMKLVEEQTEIPLYNQKLIFKGNNIVKEPTKTLADVGIKEKSKIMVIGQRHDPREEELLKSLEDTHKSIDQLSKKFKAILSDIDGMKKGFLEESFRIQFEEKVKKNLLRCTEAGMKAIESLDAIMIEEKFVDAKNKKKSLINRIQCLLDECDNTTEDLVSPSPTQ